MATMVVKELRDTVYTRQEDGSLRELVVGDKIEEGDSIIYAGNFLDVLDLEIDNTV